MECYGLHTLKETTGLFRKKEITRKIVRNNKEFVIEYKLEGDLDQTLSLTKTKGEGAGDLTIEPQKFTGITKLLIDPKDEPCKKICLDSCDNVETKKIGSKWIDSCLISLDLNNKSEKAEFDAFSPDEREKWEKFQEYSPQSISAVKGDYWVRNKTSSF